MSDSQPTTKYITTTLPYVNDDPHIGFALELIQADAFARFNQLEGFDTFFNTGADEHGQKIYRAAEEKNVPVQEYVDHFAGQFDNLKGALNTQWDYFSRTTDDNHIAAAQEFWNRCKQAGDIYKKDFTGLYCVGCEMFVTEKDLDENGRCPDHPDEEPKEVSEENYFFRLSNYEDQLLEFYQDNPDFVVPDRRFNEIKQFVKDGLEDFSISRLAEDMPWGIPVPGDDEHVMYVWFDALINYISAVGWPQNEDEFSKWWPVTQFAGKDQGRQQAVMWQAMLLSAGLDTSHQITLHGFINVDGQKMSKSVGNVVNPFELAREYGTDVVRYYLLRHIHPTKDSNFTEDSLEEAYEANLANGLGNLVSRITNMYASYDVDVVIDEDPESVLEDEDLHTLAVHVNNYRFDQAMDYIWAEIGHLDAYITETEPYKKIKSDDSDEVEEAKQVVAYLVIRLYDIAAMLEPFMPETAEKIKEIIEAGDKPDPLFARRQ